MIYYYLKNSTRKNKKLMVVTPLGKTIHFGAFGYSDFTLHKDPERKARYIARHKKREDWNDPNTAGFWALHILWGVSPNIKKCIKYIQTKYSIKIISDLN